MTSSRKSVFVVLGFVFAALVALVGPAQASTTAGDPATASAAQVDCGVRTSPGGAYLEVCDDLGKIGNAYYGSVWGTVYGETFVQVRVRYTNGSIAVLQSSTRPHFDFYIGGATSVLIRACNSNGCGAYS
ncbi:hypothetical protein FXN61_12670 [Lentzea sp. PSKA42]|uniref:Secreted protein n=1 Tax=Lentzea indica TaxID=2604800 RepID=A0ABX1FG97_9PSEU|nr:hypothetical protein [Lentzea indica]NKE57643.1 hypothetical protein [Lentzea indica]